MSEAEMAVGNERAHAAGLGDPEGLAVVAFSLFSAVVGRKNLIQDIMRLADKRDGGLRAQVLR